MFHLSSVLWPIASQSFALCQMFLSLPSPTNVLESPRVDIYIILLVHKLTHFIDILIDNLMFLVVEMFLMALGFTCLVRLMFLRPVGPLPGTCRIPAQASLLSLLAPLVIGTLLESEHFFPWYLTTSDSASQSDTSLTVLPNLSPTIFPEIL